MMISTFAVSILQASLSLPSLFSDHMVLQRDQSTLIWGTDKPNTEIQVSIQNKVFRGSTDEKGSFRIKLTPSKAGGPFDLKVKGSSERVIRDVWFGEVWICSGQSNMEWPMALANDRELGKQEADPHIRMFTVQKRFADAPVPDVNGNWQVAESNTVDRFSAVGYAYARKLWKELKVPIGMIHTSWGGTPAEAWTSLGALNDPILQPIRDRYEAGREKVPDALKKYQDRVATYQLKALPEFFNETDLSWTSAEIGDEGWSETNLPHQFPDNFDGAYYYRKVFRLTQDQLDSLKTLSLGAIDDFDMTYINGIRVGMTDMRTPNYYSAPRKYEIKPGVLKEGLNVIAIKVYDNMGGGGFFGSAAEMKLGNLSISDGWKFKQGKPHLAVDPSQTGPAPQSPSFGTDQNSPGSLYNAMLQPLAPYTVKGAIWYQGESNAGRSVQYKPLMETMIKNWREIFLAPEMPFYIVQLANFGAINPNQFDSGWAELRDVQDQLGQQKNQGTATIIDIGDPADIHPRNKKDVGERLARIALFKTYRKKLVWQGPRLKEATFLANSAFLKFDFAAGLTTRDGSAPKGFMVCDESRKWHAAQTQMIKGGIKLVSDQGNIRYIRYAWQDSPVVNVMNSDGLPMMPFRTDDFPLITRNNR
jgi:sialate O-acetylesterase